MAPAKGIKEGQPPAPMPNAAAQEPAPETPPTGPLAPPVSSVTQDFRKKPAPEGVRFFSPVGILIKQNKA